MKCLHLRSFVQWCASAFANGFSAFERLVLLFPIALTLGVAVTFLCGGHLVAAHWWGTLLASSVLFLFATRYYGRHRFVLLGGFFLLLCVTWWGCGLFVLDVMTDYGCYHLPATRLLIEGWNPIRAGTAAGIESTMGGDSLGMWLWHVLSMPKAVWYFSASAYTFFNAPFNLFFPLSVLLFVPVAASLWRYVAPSSKWLGCLFLGLLFILLPNFLIGVDCVIALAAIGLLLTMGLYLKGRGEGQALQLLCYSFWMMNSKQFALLACFIFWCCFAFLMLWRSRGQWRTLLLQGLAIVGVLGATFVVTSVSPYLTQWVNYGHPLYPCYTADEAQYPVRNIVGDFWVQNEDAQAMGHVGLFCNAYVSSTLTQTYYRWTLKQETFRPWSKTWEQTWLSSQKKEADSPLTPWIRLGYGVATLLICLWGSRTSRLLMALVWLSCFLVPTPMMGYHRYTIWSSLLLLLAFESMGNIRAVTLKRIGYGLVVGIILSGHYAKLRDYLIASDQAYMLHVNLKRETPRLLLYKPTEEKVRKDEFAWGVGPNTRKTNLDLLKREVASLKETQLIPFQEGESTDSWCYLPTLDAYIPQGDRTFEDSLFAKNYHFSNTKDRFFNYPRIVAEVIGVRMPRLLYYRLQALF